MQRRTWRRLAHWAPCLSELHPASSAANVAALRGSDGAFDLNVASAAPAFDAEEQQNIAVYKKALPSVVNITATEVRFRFFYGPVPLSGTGFGLYTQQGWADPDQ